ncbi:MAG: DUF58 domain-containing protein [Labilithrix sp.]|nr:DUF58 domain-containing protein [Labilithrix sp.]MCW5812798.1 DUF58 domain-containing protein [Labilithrix sp.]
MAKRTFRIASLFVPQMLAWIVALNAPHRDELTRAVSLALGPIWMAMAGALLLRTIALVVAQRKDPDAARIDVAERVDVLTSSGAALAWFSSFAVMGAVSIGWASLGVIGVLGTGVLDLVVLYALAVLGNGDPIRGGVVTRKLTPESVTEGDDVIEEIAFSDVRIPIGYRLFVTGRVGPRWATSRHVLEATDSESDVVLESEVGPAVRGEHDAEPLEVWLEDTFGLCRSAIGHVAPARVTVLPKVRSVDKKQALLGEGLGARVAKPKKRLPTEGNMDLREYRQGDDVRRIHWQRSLATGQVVVRVPDEIPPDRPKVRLVLDTYFPDAFALSCDAPAETLDALVAVWLGVARALVEKGVRVTLVTAAHQNGQVIPKRLEMTRRSAAQAQALGAHVTWQGAIQTHELFTDEATFVVSHGVHCFPPNDPKFKWIVVVPGEVTVPMWTLPPAGRAPFPLGHPENRWSHRTEEVRKIAIARMDHERAMRAMHTNVAPPPPGSFIAVPAGDEIRLEAVR